MNSENQITRLFGAILSELGANNKANDLPVPDLPVDPEDDESFVGGPNDKVIPLDEQKQFKDTFEKFSEARVPIESRHHAEIEGAIRRRGFETCAFYKSIRHVHKPPYPDRWGIFYIGQAVEHVASRIRDQYPAYGDPYNLSLEFLRRHERFHFGADIQTLLFEAARKKHMYMPIRNALKNHRTHFVEEALANKAAWDWAKQKRTGLKEFAEDFMSVQPNAYARFQEPKLELASEWAATVVEQQQVGTSIDSDFKHWVCATPDHLMNKSLCPEWYVDVADISKWISPAFRLPIVTSVVDSEDTQRIFRKKRFAGYRKKWEETKKRLIEDASWPSLKFRLWTTGGDRNLWTVRVVGDHGYRAHLQNNGNGVFETKEFGPHRAMGHGG